MHSLEEPSIGRVQQIKALTEVDVSAKHGWRLDLLRIALLLIARPIVGPLRPVLPEVNARPKPKSCPFSLGASVSSPDKTVVTTDASQP